MTTREIVSLQFGNYSNFVGAHFWNIQELDFDYTGTAIPPTECNHDILYREGLTSTGQVTYTPRLLLADLKGSLKTLRTDGGLAENVEDAAGLNWSNIETIKEPEAEKNEYLKDIDGPKTSKIHVKDYTFENNVTTWTDYLYSRFHPRTINIINEYQHDNGNVLFDTFPIGVNMWKSSGYSEDFSDNIRRYVEESDSIQGFNVTFDSTDAFAGLALGCIEHLADEYSKSILAFPLIASHFPDNNPDNQEERDKSNIKDSIRLMNIAMSVERLTEHANLFVPLSTGEKGWRKPGLGRNFEHLNYNSQIYYHTAAIIASVIDTLSLKYRHKSNSFTLSDICADMTGYGRKMASASLGLPFTFEENGYLIDYLDKTKKPLFTSLTPSCKIGSDKVFQLMTLRGIPELKLKLPMDKAKSQLNIAAYRCNSVKEMMQLYFQANCFLSATDITIMNRPLSLKTPFPQIVSDSLNRNGFIKEFNYIEPIQSVPILAGYHNGAFMADTLEKLHRETKRTKFSKMHMFTETGLEESEFKECLDRIEEFKDNYEDNFEL